MSLELCPHLQPIGGIPSRWSRPPTANRCECCDRIIAGAFRRCLPCEAPTVPADPRQPTTRRP